MATATQTKPGYLTTEFWSHLIVVVLGLLAGLQVIPNGLPDKYSMVIQTAAFVASAVASAAYAWSRAHTKSNHSVDYFVRELVDAVGKVNPGEAATYAKAALEELGITPKPVTPVAPSTP